MRLLVLTDWEYPCDHEFLNEVFSKRLTEKGYDLVWVMRPRENHSGMIEQYDWNGNSVYIPPKNAYDPIRTSINYFTKRMEDHTVVALLDDIESFDGIHVRNDLAMGLVASYLSQSYDIPYAHQISHLKAETKIQMAKSGESDSSVIDYFQGKLGRHLRKFVSSHATVRFPISETMTDVLREQGYSEPLIPLPTGSNTELDPDSIDPSPFIESYDIPDTPIMLYIGTMNPMRNLEFLIEVVELIRQEIPVTLLMVGGRNQEYRRRLKREAERVGVEDSVVFTGWISDRSKINQAIKVADIGLSPLPPTDVFQTNAPIKVLEYLALETPVVASDIPDHRTVVNESGGGRIVNCHSAAFAETIINLLQSDKARKRMGANGREYVQNYRSFETLTDFLEQQYNSYITDC